MITKITGEQPFQVLTNNFSISPSSEGYTLQISADGSNFSNLFTVGAGVTRLVTGVAANSYYRLSGNQSKVSINWMKTCVTEGGGSGTELQPVADFPLNAVEGTVISYTGSSSASGVYQYDGNEWTEVGADIDLSAYWTSAETQSAITAVEDHLFDVEQVTASALTELHDGLLEVSARTVDLSAYWTSAETQEAIDEAISGFTPSANSPIIPAITTQAEYEAISGDVKSGDLIQVRGVDINGDNNPESGLFEADVEEEESDGVVRKIISWGRRDSIDSVLWSGDAYPWMVDNDVNPIELGVDTFIISSDMTAEEDEAYNGIGFDADGKPVTTHIVPQYDEQTGEVTGMTREDKDILTDLPNFATINGSAITDGGNIVIEGGADMSAYYTSAQTEDAITSKNYITSAQVETQIVSKNYITSAEIADFVTSAQVETQITSKGYATVSQIPTVPTSNTAFTNDAGYITSAAIADKVSSTYVSTIWKGTQAEYDAIATKDPNTFYIIVSN